MKYVSFIALKQQITDIGSTVEVIQVTDIAQNETLNAMYKLIGCQTIDIVCPLLGGKVISIVVDDEGLLTSEEVLYGFKITDDEGREFQLVGDLVLTGVNPDTGDTASCPASTKEIETLFQKGQITPITMKRAA